MSGTMHGWITRACVSLCALPLSPEGEGCLSCQ